MRATALTSRDLALDARRVLLVGERVQRELDDLLLPVERVPPPDVDVRAGDLEHVVAGPRVAPQAKRRDGAGVDHEQVLEPPGVRDVLVPREDDVDPGTLKALDRVARVVDDVSLAAGPGDREQVVVADEDPELGRLGELLLDPAVPPAADLAVVEVRLG